MNADIIKNSLRMYDGEIINFDDFCHEMGYYEEFEDDIIKAVKEFSLLEDVTQKYNDYLFHENMIKALNSSTH